MCCKRAPGRNLSTHTITVGPWHPMLCIVALGITGPGRALSHPCPGLLGGQMRGATV